MAEIDALPKGLVTQSARHYEAVKLSRSSTTFGIYEQEISLDDVDVATPKKPVFYIKPYIAYVVREAKDNESTGAITYNNKRYIETTVDDITSDKVIFRARVITSHIKRDFDIHSFSLLNDAEYIDEYNVTGGYVYAIQNLTENIVHNTSDLEIIELAMLIDFQKEMRIDA